PGRQVRDPLLLLLLVVLAAFAVHPAPALVLAAVRPPWQGRRVGLGVLVPVVKERVQNGHPSPSRTIITPHPAIRTPTPVQPRTWSHGRFQHALQSNASPTASSNLSGRGENANSARLSSTPAKKTQATGFSGLFGTFFLIAPLMSGSVKDRWSYASVS